MNYLSILLLSSGLFLSTNVKHASKVNFEKLENVNAEFVQFLSLFDKTHLPYEMSLEEVIALNESDSRLDRQQSILINSVLLEASLYNTAFSRLGPPQIKPLKRFYTSNKTIAVTYLQKGFAKASGAIMIAIFDLKGRLLSKKEDNGKVSKKKFKSFPMSTISNTDFNETQSFKITPEGLIYKTIYKNIWKKDTHEFGFHENEIIDRKIASEEIIQIKSDGSISSIDKYNYDGMALARP